MRSFVVGTTNLDAIHELHRNFAAGVEAFSENTPPRNRLGADAERLSQVGRQGGLGFIKREAEVGDADSHGGEE